MCFWDRSYCGEFVLVDSSDRRTANAAELVPCNNEGAKAQSGYDVLSSALFPFPCGVVEFTAKLVAIPTAGPAAIGFVDAAWAKQNLRRKSLADPTSAHVWFFLSSGHKAGGRMRGPQQYARPLQAGDEVTVTFSPASREVSFAVNGRRYGYAFALPPSNVRLLAFVHVPSGSAWAISGTAPTLRVTATNSPREQSEANPILPSLEVNDTRWDDDNRSMAVNLSRDKRLAATVSAPRGPTAPGYAAFATQRLGLTATAVGDFQRFEARLVLKRTSSEWPVVIGVADRDWVYPNYHRTAPADAQKALSWYITHQGVVVWSGQNGPFCGYRAGYCPGFGEGDLVGVEYNCRDLTLSFTVNGQNFGPAFEDIVAELVPFVQLASGVQWFLPPKDSLAAWRPLPPGGGQAKWRDGVTDIHSGVRLFYPVGYRPTCYRLKGLLNLPILGPPTPHEIAADANLAEVPPEAPFMSLGERTLIYAHSLGTDVFLNTNHVMRNGTDEQLLPFRDYIFGLDAVLEGMPEEQAVSYRGIDIVVPAELYVVGKTLVLQAFTSATKRESLAARWLVEGTSSTGTIFTM